VIAVACIIAVVILVTWAVRNGRWHHTTNELVADDSSAGASETDSLLESEGARISSLMLHFSKKRRYEV
jgi:hypothetical protein